MRDTLVHRGPDGAGMLDLGNVLLGHRRLAVVELGAAGEQPMRAADGRCALVYNGELYNDAELRAELLALGVAFAGGSDAETVLHALAVWGAAGVRRLRGMFALAFVDERSGTLLLVRDPMGIKPLYLHRMERGGGAEVVFGSEVGAVLAHPHVSAKPDLRGVSAYLTTIRTVIGERTMFAGVRAVRAGEVLEFDLKSVEVRERRVEVDWVGSGAGDESVREVVSDSVRRHLRADVPVCCLLSGGLDSSIVGWCTARESKSTDFGSEQPKSVARFDTYCSGASGGENDDFRFARMMAERLGSRHVEAPVTRELFAARWPEMVAAQGVPLSTPNEVAINEVARRARADGNIVALSGEGADELFGGYDVPLTDAARFEGLIPSAGGGGGGTRAGGSPGAFQLLANAWVPPGSKAGLLRDDVWRALEGDADLVELYEWEFAAAADGAAPDSPLQAHLRFQRRTNLVGLLQRLDSATMLAGVEGRTPLADIEVCRAAERLPMARKFTLSPGRTKIALREAFGRELPGEIVGRAKASFPLPFQEWIGDCAPALLRSGFVRQIVSPGALELVAASTGANWRVAWPLVNLAMWGERWWG